MGITPDFPEQLVSRLHALMSSIRLPAEFSKSDALSHDRLVFDGEGRAHAAMAMCEAWSCPSARLVWFTLESRLPHVSTIAACFGLPAPSLHGPLLTLNLNFKPQFGSLGCIAGYRSSDPLEGAQIAGRIPHPSSRPIVDVTIPDDFFGVRSIYEASPSLLEWALRTWEALVRDWVDRCGSPRPDTTGDLQQAAVARQKYIDDIKKLHADGGVFDAIFGQGWVASTFSDFVFPAEENPSS